MTFVELISGKAPELMNLSDKEGLYRTAAIGVPGIPSGKESEDRMSDWLGKRSYPKAGNFPVVVEGVRVGAVAAMPVRVLLGELVDEVPDGLLVVDMELELVVVVLRELVDDEVVDTDDEMPCVHCE